MASLELSGKIIRKLLPQSGQSARGPWFKQEFVIEFQDGNFPQQACFNVWGEDKVKELENFNLNDEVKVSFRPSSREFNGRWYTDLRAWKIEREGAAPAVQPLTEPTQAGSSDVPAGFAPRTGTNVPPPTVEDMSGETEDDLPF